MLNWIVSVAFLNDWWPGLNVCVSFMLVFYCCVINRFKTYQAEPVFTEYLTVPRHSLTGASGSRSSMTLLSRHDSSELIWCPSVLVQAQPWGWGALSIGLPDDMGVSFPWEKQSKRERKWARLWKQHRFPAEYRKCHSMCSEFCDGPENICSSPNLWYLWMPHVEESLKVELNCGSWVPTSWMNRMRPNVQWFVSLREEKTLWRQRQGLAWPWVRDHPEPPEPGRGKNKTSLQACPGSVGFLTTCFHFWPPKPWQNKFLLF